MSNKVANVSSAIGIIGMTLLAVAVTYLFYTHIFIVNVCPAGRNLIATNSGPLCYPSINNTIILDGKSYYNNVTIINGSANVSVRFLGKNPLLSIWNQNISESAGNYVFLSIPDTFAVNMRYSSNVTTEMMILSNTGYVNWTEKRPYVKAADYIGSDISFWFNDSEGCAGYVAVIRQPNNKAFLLVPDETALYVPANHSTGICAA